MKKLISPILRLAAIAVLLLWTLSACQAGEPEGEGRCGDGVCDEAEQKNPALCLEDCLQGGAPERGRSTSACEQGEWGLVIECCATWTGTEPAGECCTEVSVCLTVDEDCNFRGTGSGRYSTCSYTSTTGLCTYSMQCPDFTMPVSGQVLQGEDGAQIFRIIVDASRIFEAGTATCQGQSFPLENMTMLQGGFASAMRNNGGFLAEVEAGRGGAAELRVEGEDAVAGGAMAYSFNLNLYPDCNSLP